MSIAFAEKPFMNQIECKVIPFENRKSVTLASVEHKDYQNLTENTWEIIENQVRKSSIVWLEYFPEELRRSIYQVPVFGFAAKKCGMQIDSFFDTVTFLAKKYKKPIAVSDIANGMPFVYYDKIPRLLSAATLPPSVLFYLFNNDSTLLKAAPLSAGFCYLEWQEFKNQGPYSNKRQAYEEFIPTLVDARRLFTTLGIIDELSLKKNGSNVTYFSPPAHNDRIEWYFSNWDKLSTKVKEALYRCFFGLPFKTRYYRYSEKFDSWMLVSNRSI